MEQKNLLVLHIGTLKTGTSSLQYFLTDNSSKLEQYGWSYPHFRQPGGAATRNLDVFLSDSSDVFLEQIVKTLNMNNVILSSEMAWLAIKWGGGKQMLRNLYTVWDNLKVVVYLRRQDFYVETFWNEYVKAGLADLSLENFEEEMGDGCDYGKRLDEIAEIIGADNIVVRIYKEEGFNTIYDFMKYLDLVDCYNQCVQNNQRKNERTDIECLKLARICNSVLTREQSFGIGLPMRKVFSEIADSKKEENCKERGKYFSPQQRKDILKKWEKQNCYLAKKYLGREKLFTNEVTEYPFYNPSVSKMEETIVKMFMLIEVKRQNAMKFFLMNRQKKIAFWGAGVRCNAIMNNGFIPDIIIDNDWHLRGEQLNGVPIMSVNAIDDLKEYCIVITVQNSQEICEQCKSYGMIEGKEFICGEDMI